MSTTVRFDDALARFAALTARVLGSDKLDSHYFLRDASGRVTLVLGDRVDPPLRAQLANAAAAELAPYVESASAALATPDELFDPTPEGIQLERLVHPDFQGVVRLLERQIVGVDWLGAPRAPISGAPPIVVFASYKGGVGRSTALAVTASDLATRGHSVLAIDLDLEAPGLGGMLLPEDALPDFGALDFFVENGLAPLDDAFIRDLHAPSPLTASGGLVHVVPATGRRSVQSPQNVLAKLARAYLEDPADDGSHTFLDQTRDLITHLTQRTSYDVILVDTRAGLHETTAAAVLGLGAEVLLFGVDTPQTFQGYRFLLAHLARFAPAVPVDDDWRLRLRLVHAKASADHKRREEFRDRAFELFADHLYNEDDPDKKRDPDAPGAFNFDIEDTEAPHHAWSILNDASFSEFDPLAHPEHLSEEIYIRTFGSFLAALRERAQLTERHAP